MVMADRREQIGDVVVVERIADVTAVAAPAHQPQRPQKPQVMRGRTQAQAGGSSELLDGAVPIEKLGKKPQAGRRAERLQGLGELAGLLGSQPA